MTLKARLLLGMALVALMLGLVAMAVTRTTQGYLVSQVDEQLRGVGATIRPILARQGVDPEAGLSELYVAFVRRDGSIATVVSPNLSTERLPPPVVPPEQIQGIVPGVERSFTAPAQGGGARYRVLVTTGPQGRVLIAALPLTDVDEAVARLVRVEILASAAILGTLALVTFWVLRLGVRPIKQMTATATAIAGGDLSQRVPDVAPGTEAGDLGAALNQMMGRIEGAFADRARSEERLRRFVADASHELRTPVTTIRGYAELYRRGGLDEGDDLSEAMRRTEQEAVRMGSLIDDLLLLARLDQGRPLERAAVDLAVLTADAGRDARAVQPGRPITVEADGPLPVVGDEGRLRQVLGNLVGNALLHTDEQVPVLLRTGRFGDNAVLEVHDDGPGMPPEVAERAFERFYRADPARARHRGGSGLGLSIAQAVVDAHGGTIAVRSAPGTGTTIRVQLPLAAPGPPG